CIRAGKASLPLSFPPAMRFATTRSISDCERTPTFFRNFRILILKFSAFMVHSFLVTCWSCEKDNAGFAQPTYPVRQRPCCHGSLYQRQLRVKRRTRNGPT